MVGVTPKEKRKGCVIMKITKRAFVEAMVGNLTMFCGVTSRILPEDELHSFIKKLDENRMYYESRSCEAHSTYLKFSNGSYLYLNEVGSHDYYKYEFPEGIMYVCCHTYHDDFDNVDRVKAMYYCID
jgi:hypothetical protein